MFEAVATFPDKKENLKFSWIKLANLASRALLQGLLNHIDILCVLPTGAGKSIVIYVYALCIRKLNPKGLVVVGQPLSALITEQHQNPLRVRVLTMSMGAKMKGTAVEALIPPSGQTSGDLFKDVTVEEACSGSFAVFFGHPEAFDSRPGQDVLRRMAKEEIIMAVMIDEVHQGPGCILIDI